MLLSLCFPLVLSYLILREGDGRCPTKVRDTGVCGEEESLQTLKGSEASDPSGFTADGDRANLKAVIRRRLRKQPRRVDEVADKVKVQLLLILFKEQVSLVMQITEHCGLLYRECAAVAKEKEPATGNRFKVQNVEDE